MSRRQDSDGERGTTLAELTVSMLVFGIFGAFLATTVVQTTRLARESAVRENTAQRASLLVEQVTKDLRAAVRVGPAATTQTAFTAAGPDAVSFYVSATPHVLREELSFATSAAAAAAGTSCTPGPVACQLWRETQRPDDATVFPDLRYTDPARTRVQRLAPSDLAHTVSFRYLLKGGTSTVPAALTTLELQSIEAVEVRVSVDGDGPGGLDPVVLQNTVRPYNG